MMKKYLCWFVSVSLFLSLLFLGSGCVAEAEIPNRPQESTVLDETNSLSETTIATIDNQNKAWSMTDEQLQVAVYMTNQLSSDIESVANEVFRKWQVGFADTNNGVLLLIALEDREFRLETSDKAATILTDVTSKRILESARSFFKEEDYDNGILYIVDAIGDQFYGTNQAQERIEEFEEEDDDEIFLLGIVVIFIFIVLLLIPKGRSGGGGRGKGNGGNDLLLWLLLNSSSNSSNHHSSNSSGFGGNNWSGGGGGGGGASSGW